MTGPLVTVLALAAVTVAVEALRFSAERTRADQWALIADGDPYDRDALHNAVQTLNTTGMLRFAAFMGVLFAYQWWARTGHANAMSRLDLGLGWLRALPGGRGITWTYSAWMLSLFAMVYISWVANSNLSTASGYESAANIDAGYSLVRMALALFLSAFVVQLTLGLQKQLATPLTPVAAPVRVEAQG
jgi:hypothetical protein